MTYVPNMIHICPNTCFSDLSMIREYPFINESKNGLGDFLKG